MTVAGHKASEHPILVLGGTGFVGRRLVRRLLDREDPVRIFSRHKGTGDEFGRHAGLDIATGDLARGDGLEAALAGVRCAFYLVHSMGGRSLFKSGDYADRDLAAARNFMTAAERAGLERVIYLGALGEAGEDLSEHLKSRAEVARVLASGTPRATILRAAIIIGAGGASFEMLRYLVERLPIMGCPKWIDTRIQPIAVEDVLAFLTGCLDNPETAGRTFDIGGPEVLTYREMMQQYAEARGLARRLIVRVPGLTPILSAYWVDLVTPVPSGVAHPLIEGLRNEVVCRNTDIDRYVAVARTPFQAAVRAAFAEETSGPGIDGF